MFMFMKIPFYPQEAKTTILFVVSLTKTDFGFIYDSKGI